MLVLGILDDSISLLLHMDPTKQPQVENHHQAKLTGCQVWGIWGEVFITLETWKILSSGEKHRFDQIQPVCETPNEIL